VKGGVNAGMTVFGYTELMSEKRLKEAGAHHTFDNMNQLVSEIQKYEKKLYNKFKNENAASGTDAQKDARPF